MRTISDERYLRFFLFHEHFHARISSAVHYRASHNELLDSIRLAELRRKRNELSAQKELEYNPFSAIITFCITKPVNALEMVLNRSKRVKGKKAIKKVNSFMADGQSDGIGKRESIKQAYEFEAIDMKRTRQTEPKLIAAYFITSAGSEVQSYHCEEQSGLSSNHRIGERRGSQIFPGAEQNAQCKTLFCLQTGLESPVIAKGTIPSRLHNRTLEWINMFSEHGS
jgi:hypothetical protein